MLTKADRIQILEQEYMKRLQEPKDMPSDLAEKYSLWIRGKIQQAMQLSITTGNAQPAPEQDKQEAAS